MLWLLSVNNDDKSDDDNEIECMLSTSHVECRHTHVLKWTFSSNVTKTDIFVTLVKCPPKKGIFLSFKINVNKG